MTRDPTYRPVIDYHLVMGSPSIGGREVIERRPLPTGSLLEVVRITRCTNCPFSRIRFEVRIGPEEALESKPVFVDNRFTLITTGEDGTMILNPDIFGLISN